MPVASEPADAARKAMQIYDKNGDGSLDQAELRSALALNAARDRIDGDGNGEITQDEIEKRLSTYREMSDFVATTIQVVRDGQPVTGARVTLTAEPFLGENYQVFSGETDEGGSVMVAPPSGEMAGILPTGLYHVRIESDKTVQRGCELADDVASVNRLVFSL